MNHLYQFEGIKVMVDLTNGTTSITLPESLNPLFERAPIRSAEDFWLLELEVYNTSAMHGDRIIAMELQRVHPATTFVDWAVEKARDESPCRLVNKGWRETSVLLKGGSRIVIKTPYLREDRHGNPGPKREKRGRNGAGIYPVLVALGIRDGVTPATRSEGSGGERGDRISGFPHSSTAMEGGATVQMGLSPNR